ncbi:hypothetical protein IFM89_036785, partial [Coptis chinensis]
MDRKSWLWRKKSSEKSPGETESSGSMLSHSERYSDDQVFASANATPGLGRYPSFKREVDALDKFKNDAKKMVVALVDIEVKHWNSNGPKRKTKEAACSKSKRKEEILLRLPVEDLLRCKSVCTKWYELIKEPDFISMQVTNAICQPSRIIFAPKGLYWNEDPTNALFLIGKGKCTTIPVKILKLSCDCRIAAGVIITEGESSWRQLKFPYEVNFQYGLETVFLDGALHWMIDTEDTVHPTTLSERILALDVSNEEFHTINIPPSIVLPDSLILINLAGYLAFVESTLDTSSQIWQIVGSKTNGRQIFPYSCKCVSETDGLNYFCRLLNMLTDGCYYYQATERLQENRSISQQIPKPCDHLALYNPEKDQSFFLNLHGIPRSFHTMFFTPTLVSPEAIYFPPE